MEEAYQELDRHLSASQPDIVIGQNRGALQLLAHTVQRGYPSFLFVRDLEAIKAGLAIAERIHVIANSSFTASVITTKTSHPSVGVVLPFVDPEEYRVTERERRYITFINPNPFKGLCVAVEVARRLPQERFLFVKGKTAWSDPRTEVYLKFVYSMPNVEIWDHQQDMRRVYAQTDILFVPSQWEEAFGRVILEAHINGIPVVAAHTGGIPYTLGQGGILIEPKDDTKAYVKALRRLRQDEEFYQHLSSLALQNSRRPEFDPQYQVQTFIRFVERCIQRE